MYKCFPGTVAIIGFLILTTPAEAVTTFQRTYGDTGWFSGRSIQETPDGGYIIAGGISSFFYIESSDVYLIKIDAAGYTVWTKTYGGNQSDYVSSLQKTHDGGYIITGWTNSFGVEVDTMGDEAYYYSDVYLIRIDAAGDTLWTQTYGGSDTDSGSSVQETQDGGYIIAGSTSSFGAGRGRCDVYLIRTDAAGDTVWTRTYGGSDSDSGSSVQETQDGGFIIAGWTTSFGAGSFDVYLIKTDAAGDTVWTKTYGGRGYDIGVAIQETQDGGLIIAGMTNIFDSEYYDVYLIRTDAAGDTLWTRTYGGTAVDACTSVLETQDGGYIIAGMTTSFGAGESDVYLIRTDAAGDTLWTKTYGGSDTDSGNSVQETQDGGFIIAGMTTSFGADSMAVYIVKTDSQGNTSLQPAGFGWSRQDVPFNVSR